MLQHKVCVKYLKQNFTWKNWNTLSRSNCNLDVSETTLKSENKNNIENSRT